MKQNTYKSPALDILQLATEQVFLSGSDNKWYNNGGTGDFDYGITNDDEWA